MNTQIRYAHKFTKIEELHEIILPILDRSTEHLHKSESQLEFQSLTHQIVVLLDDYIKMDAAITARSLSPKNKEEQPILHYPTQRLLDSGYVAKTFLGIRKITEATATDETKLVYSFPTIIDHLKQYRTFLDSEGWVYLVSLSRYPNLKTHTTEEKLLVIHDFADPDIYKNITIYRQKNKPGKPISYQNGVLCFLNDMNDVITIVRNLYKLKADKIYAHAADRQTWGSPQDMFTTTAFADFSKDLLLLLAIHYMLYILIVGNDIGYTFTPTSYGLAEDFNLSAESVEIVYKKQNNLVTEIQNTSFKADSMLRNLSTFRKFVDDLKRTHV